MSDRIREALERARRDLLSGASQPPTDDTRAAFGEAAAQATGIAASGKEGAAGGAQRPASPLRWSQEGNVEPLRKPDVVARFAPGHPGPASPGSVRRLPLNAAVAADRRIIAGMRAHAFVEGFRILRTQLLQRMRERGWMSVAVTSARPGEGKTLVAANLAISIAMDHDATAILVDANLARPHLHETLGIPAAPGLTDLLAGRSSPAEALVVPGIDRLMVLPAGPAIDNSSEMLGSREMANVLAALRAIHPAAIIVIDTPSLLDSADTLELAAQVDCAVLVTSEAQTQKAELLQATELLVSHCPLAGTMLNRVGRERLEPDRPFRQLANLMPRWLSGLMRRA